MDGELSLIEMELRELQMKHEPLGGGQVVVLAEKNGPREFPIWIGYHEALALDSVLHGQKSPRPLTHDLITNVINGLAGELNHIIVDSLQQQTFYGKLAIKTAAGTEELIDSRPSDAIILATKMRRPIFVAEEVLNEVLRDQDEL